METIDIKEIRYSDSLLRQVPEASQFDRVIRNDCIIRLRGVPVGVYVKLAPADVVEMRDIARKTKFVSTARARKGLPTQSSVFGSLPRTPIRVDFCRFTKTSESEREHFETSFKFAELIDSIYKSYLPEAHGYNTRLVEKSVHKDWRVNDTPFTTCNFNINHAIRHHRDSGNFKGVYSNVLILKENVSGGELVFPEFGIALEQSDCALGIFDGQRWIHGVMPITREKPNGYRASIVFYALAGMAHCYPYKAELERFKSKRTHREAERVKGNSNLKRMVGR